jgi:hypothetical protein
MIYPLLARLLLFFDTKRKIGEGKADMKKESTCILASLTQIFLLAD